MTKVNYRWLKNINDAKQRQAFEQQILADKQILERLDEILSELAQELETKELGLNQFENPNWAYEQAFRNGQRSSIQLMKTLFTHIQDS